MTTPTTGETPVMAADSGTTAGRLRAAMREKHEGARIPPQITMSAAADQHLGPAPGVTLAEPMTGSLAFAEVCSQFTPDFVEELMAREPLPTGWRGVTFTELDDVPAPEPEEPDEPRAGEPECDCDPKTPGACGQAGRTVSVQVRPIPLAMRQPPLDPTKRGAHRPRRHPVRNWLRQVWHQMCPPIEGRQMPQQEPAP